MSRWWRIADHRWATDKSGQGMAIFGGRWNPIGVPAIYGAESIALASLEKWVHLAGVMPVKPLALVAVDVPEGAGQILEMSGDDLPASWNVMPSSEETAVLGAAHFRPDDRGNYAVLGFAVPSVVVPESRNIVLNPQHPGMAQVSFTVSRDFVYDARMGQG